MTLFAWPRILKISFGKKNADLSHYPKIAEKKKNHQILQLFLGLFYHVEVVDSITFQHTLV